MLSWGLSHLYSSAQVGECLWRRRLRVGAQGLGSGFWGFSVLILVVVVIVMWQCRDTLVAHRAGRFGGLGVCFFGGGGG